MIPRKSRRYLHRNYNGPTVKQKHFPHKVKLVEPDTERLEDFKDKKYGTRVFSMVEAFTIFFYFS